jgi:acyl-CoA synthetase (AMP-forming)/AMP-acid ligase II
MGVDLRSSPEVVMSVEIFAALPDLIRAHARTHPQRVALVHGERSIEYSAFDRMADRVAVSLQRDGLQPRDSVAICAATAIESVAIFLGSLRAGMAVAPLGLASGARAVAGMIGDSGACKIFLDRAAADAFAEGSISLTAPAVVIDDLSIAGLQGWMAQADSAPVKVDIQPDWPCNIIYSSGTTGVPKGIVQSHLFRWSNMQRAAMFGYSSRSVTLLATPLYSNTTLATLFGALSQGGTVVLMDKFTTDGYLSLAQRVRATHTVLVPVQYQRLLAHESFGAFDLSAFLMKFSTGAPFAAALKEQVLQRWPGGLIEIYGMTEGGGACMLEAHKHRDKLHTVGTPMPGHDIRVIDAADREVAAGEPGEIAGYSPTMMTRYLNQPSMTAAAEWYASDGRRFVRTGDIGSMDADGFLTLLDRKKDMIISGGFNIFPSDLEAVLRDHPGVEEAAVVGVASPRWGETPVACVAPKHGVRLDAVEIRDWANCRLGKMQRIEAVKIMSALPRNALGKVLKGQLRAAFI